MARYIRMNINDGIRVKSEEEVPVEMVNTIVTDVSETIENSMEAASEEDDIQDTKTDNVIVSDYLGDDEEADNENAIDIDDIDWNTIFDS